MADTVDIDLSTDDPLEWVLADGNGPVDFTGATSVRCFITGPRPSTMRVEWPCSATGLGRVTIPRDGISPGWEGFEFTVTWGTSGAKTFPDGGPRWLLAA